MRKFIKAVLLGAVITTMFLQTCGAAEQLLDTVTAPQIGSIGGEWAVIALSRSGAEVPDGYYDGYLDSVEEAFASGNGSLNTRKYTDYARVSLGIASLGENPQDFRGWNVLEPLKDIDKVKVQGSNGPIWALIAIDSNDYEGFEDTESILLETVLDLQNDDGGYALLSGDTSDADLTAMAMTALSAHQSDEEVQQAIEQGIRFLDQGLDQGYMSCESYAQCLVAFASLNLEEEAELCVQELEKFSVNGGYMHTVDEAQMNAMATEQALYSLAAYERMKKGQSRLFDMRDTDGDEPNGEDDNLSCKLSISCETLVDNDALQKSKRGLVPESGYILAPEEAGFTEGETVFDVLYRETRERKIHMEYEKTPAYNSIYIEGIGNLYEFDAGPESGWMYRVNGEFPNYGCSAITLSDGDVVEWLYTCDLGQDIGCETMY